MFTPKCNNYVIILMINKSNMKQTKTYEMPLSEVRSTRIRACILAGSPGSEQHGCLRQCKGLV